MGDSALLSFKGEMLGGRHPRLLQKHKADGKQSNLDRSHGQVEASPLRRCSDLILMSEELGEGGRERNEREHEPGTLKLREQHPLTSESGIRNDQGC